MSRLAVHAALPQASRDETARQDFVRDLRRRLAGMSAALPGRYAAVAPAYERTHGPIKDRHDARAALIERVTRGMAAGLEAGLDAG
jgi:hypothetical protein